MVRSFPVKRGVFEFWSLLREKGASFCRSIGLGPYRAFWRNSWWDRTDCKSRRWAMDLILWWIIHKPNRTLTFSTNLIRAYIPWRSYMIERMERQIHTSIHFFFLLTHWCNRERGNCHTFMVTHRFIRVQTIKPTMVICPFHRFFNA